MPVKILKMNKSFIPKYYFEIFNENFPKQLKLADIIPVYRNRYDKKTQNLLSLLPAFLKIFERPICKSVCRAVPKYQTGHQKGYSSYYSLIAMFEKWKKHLDRSAKCVTLFIDVFKAFSSSLQYDLSLVKLSLYKCLTDFEINILK